MLTEDPHPLKSDAMANAQIQAQNTPNEIKQDDRTYTPVQLVHIAHAQRLLWQTWWRRPDAPTPPASTCSSDSDAASLGELDFSEEEEEEEGEVEGATSAVAGLLHLIRCVQQHLDLASIPQLFRLARALDSAPDTERPRIEQELVRVIDAANTSHCMNC